MAYHFNDEFVKKFRLCDSHRKVVIVATWPEAFTVLKPMSNNWKSTNLRTNSFIQKHIQAFRFISYCTTIDYTARSERKRDNIWNTLPMILCWANRWRCLCSLNLNRISSWGHQVKAILIHSIYETLFVCFVWQTFFKIKFVIFY